MGKSSIHIQAVKKTSERHNTREQDLKYVRKDLSHLNSFFNFQKISDAEEFARTNCQEKTGRKMQEIAKPIREGVLLIDEHHTVDDLKRLAEKIENRFGIKTIQGYCHKDEGHYDKITKEWKPNFHAHMVFDWQDKKTGKSIKMRKDDLSELQTLVADELNLERGIPSTIKHLNAIEFKIKKIEEDLIEIHKLEKGLGEATKILKQVESMQKEIERLKDEKKAIEDKTELVRANLKYIENKTDIQRDELKEIEKKAQQVKQNQGFKMR